MPVPPSIYGQRSEISIKEKYRIPGAYVFYPAHFWPHKNHVYLLDGLRILKEQHGVVIHAILTGNNTGNRGYIERKAREYGIADQLRFPGFVPYDEVPLLYEQALALVMPTYFGPTNIPPMEAFSLGCPVCYSDLPGLRDQVGDAAFLMDLTDPHSLAKHLMTIRSDTDLVAEKVAAGRKLLAGWTDADFWAALDSLLSRYFYLSERWKS